MEVLYAHVKAQKSDFDEWHLWLNTFVPEDIEYCDSLAARHSWIRVIRCPDIQPDAGTYNIHHFFKGCEPTNVYLRLDDDVVYLEPGFVNKMFAYRLSHPEYFLVYANIINNSMISHLHMRVGHVRYRQKVQYRFEDPVGWEDPHFAEVLHRAFLQDAERNATEKWKLPDWILWPHERVSINCISWIGNPGLVGLDEEHWLSEERPIQLGKYNIICGDAMCAHFAFHVQRDHLDATDILERYRAIAPPLLISS
jgi:hypothetical protein